MAFKMSFTDRETVGTVFYTVCTDYGNRLFATTQLIRDLG